MAVFEFAAYFFAALAFFVGWALRGLVDELTPYFVFWYNMTVRKEPLGDEQRVVKDLSTYNQLTLRKRFIMERNKRLN